MAGAIVIGAGLGGLAAAIHLRLAGWKVLVCERNAELGGKAGRVSWDGYRFDTGPSVLTLPQVIEDLFVAARRKRADYFEFIPVEPGCRYSWPDGTVFDAPGTRTEFRASVARHFPKELAGFDRFCRYLDDLWAVSWPVFLQRPLTARTLLTTPVELLRPALALLRPGSMANVVRAHFRDPKLIQLFLRFATYNGSDPERAPSAFNVIAQAELGFGSWTVKGGLHVLVSALARLADELGVEIRRECPVARVRFSRSGRVEGVVLADGQVLDAAAVVVNQDAVAARTGPLLADHPQARAWRRRYARTEPSGSGFVLLAALNRRHRALASHNVFFSADYPREFREQFKERRPLTDPTIYVSVPVQHDPTAAPPGGEGWFVLVNAPSARGGPGWPDAYGHGLLERLVGRVAGFSLEQVIWREERRPEFFARTYGAWEGTLYGPSSNNLWAAFRRVPNRGDVPGLAFAGGSAHPGGGIPLVLLSGKLAAESLG